MPPFAITEKRPLINTFKLSGTYYFKYFFDDPSLNRSMRRRDTGPQMAPAGERNKVMKDMVWVERAVVMGQW
jgi:hypothetical protein